MFDEEGLRCSAPGLDVVSGRWQVQSFYEEQFNDRVNFNLDENTVSLVTAVLTSISLLLLADIFFRVTVRARGDKISKQLIFRHHVLNTFSNPITLLLSLPEVYGRSTQNRVEHDEIEVGKPSTDSGPMVRRATLRTWAIAFMGLVLVLVEFLFIFFATNRNSAKELDIDEVPVFEIEDRGCEYIPTAVVNACSQTGLTSKAGFNLRASIQTCSSFHISPARGPLDFNVSGLAFILFGITPIRTSATIAFDRTQVRMDYGISVRNSADGNGLVFYGNHNVTAESMKNALLSRLQRTNVTVLTVESSNQTAAGTRNMATPFSQIHHLVKMQQELEEFYLVVFGVDVGEVVLSETHLPVIYNTSKLENESLFMLEYLQDLVRSIIFPSGRGSAFHIAEETQIGYLLEIAPGVFFNRPWVGIVHSMAICIVLLVTFVVLVIFRVEGTIDDRWAWKEFFADTRTVNDFGIGDDSHLKMGWKTDISGKRTYGFIPEARATA
ncbi:hypothetical protein FGB62_10g26 [Gracilaria domingensis]|nr:hypothetical protein FGB62_10g26 [Gracilaria domingensis]